jgi:hypothetical protein
MQGDTVNTASRMCSNGEPWRTQLHPSTVLALQCSPSPPCSRNFIIIPRGATLFKGKGLIATSWLSTPVLDAVAESVAGVVPYTRANAVVCIQLLPSPASAAVEAAIDAHPICSDGGMLVPSLPHASMPAPSAFATVIPRRSLWPQAARSFWQGYRGFALTFTAWADEEAFIATNVDRTAYGSLVIILPGFILVVLAQVVPGLAPVSAADAQATSDPRWRSSYVAWDVAVIGLLIACLAIACIYLFPAFSWLRNRLYPCVSPTRRLSLRPFEAIFVTASLLMSSMLSSSYIPIDIPFEFGLLVRSYPMRVTFHISTLLLAPLRTVFSTD